MQVKTLQCKAKAIYQQHPETPLASLGPSSSEMDWHKVEKCAVVWRVHISNCFWKLWTSCPPGQRGKGPSGSHKFKSQHLWWYGGELVPMEWVTCTSVKAPLMLKGTYRFWSNIRGHPSNIFFRDVPVYFSKTMPSHILHVLQQHGFVVRVRVLDWPACSPDLFPIENVWRIMKRKIWQRRPRTVEHLKLYSSQTLIECG